MVYEYNEEKPVEEIEQKPKSKKQQDRVLEIGENFGAMTVIDLSIREDSFFIDGIEFEQNFKFYVLKCDCGKVKEFRADRFLGKRKTQDCGCGRGWMREPKEDLLLRIPVTLANRARALAKQSGGNLSQWIRNAMQERLDRIDKNEG